MTMFETNYWGSSKSSSDKTPKSDGGTNSFEVSLWLIFYNEITRLSNANNPPTFDGGTVTEQLGKGKYKVKLQGVGSVVTAEYSGDTTKPRILKGAYVLVMIKTKNRSGGTDTIYSIQGVRQTGSFAPKSETYQV